MRCTKLHNLMVHQKGISPKKELVCRQGHVQASNSDKIDTFLVKFDLTNQLLHKTQSIGHEVNLKFMDVSLKHLSALQAMLRFSNQLMFWHMMQLAMSTYALCIAVYLYLYSRQTYLKYVYQCTMLKLLQITE